MKTKRRNEQEWFDELVQRYSTMLTDELIYLEAGLKATVTLLTLDIQIEGNLAATQTRLDAIQEIISKRLYG